MHFRFSVLGCCLVEALVCAARVCKFMWVSVLYLEDIVASSIGMKVSDKNTEFLLKIYQSQKSHFHRNIQGFLSHYFEKLKCDCLHAEKKIVP